MNSYIADPYDPCPCGSGKKYRFCCQKKHQAQRRDERVNPTYLRSRVAAWKFKKGETEHGRDSG